MLHEQFRSLILHRIDLRLDFITPLRQAILHVRDLKRRNTASNLITYPRAPPLELQTRHWHSAYSPGQTVLPTQANSSQVHNFDGVGYRLVTHLARVGLNLVKLKVSPNSSQVFHPLATSATLAKLLCYCYVTTRSYSDNGMVSCKLARLSSIIWPPANANFDFATWLELAWVGSTVWPGLNPGGSWYVSRNPDRPEQIVRERSVRS